MTSPGPCPTLWSVVAGRAVTPHGRLPPTRLSPHPLAPAPTLRPCSSLLNRSPAGLSMDPGMSTPQGPAPLTWPLPPQTPTFPVGPHRFLGPQLPAASSQPTTPWEDQGFTLAAPGFSVLWASGHSSGHRHPHSAAHRAGWLPRPSTHQCQPRPHTLPLAPPLVTAL